jgi:hypothetical protein
MAAVMASVSTFCAYGVYCWTFCLAELVREMKQSDGFDAGVEKVDCWPHSVQPRRVSC